MNQQPVEEEEAVLNHYGIADLSARLTEALARRPENAPPLRVEDLEALDQFHVGGLRITRELGSLLKLNGAANVLDVGCGLGGPARYFSTEYGCNVTAVDLNPAFIAAATMLSSKVGLAGRISFHTANALSLPFADATFDCLYTQHVAMNIADREAFYRSLTRVLKPGGTLAFYDPIAGENAAPHFPMPWATTAATSFLLNEAQLDTVLAKSGLHKEIWQNKTADGLQWFAEQARKPQDDALGLHLVMGPMFKTMAQNLQRNLKEGRVELLLAVLRKKT